MHEFRRVIPWMDDDAAGFGDSNADYETTEIAGNTFDYPYVHGQGLPKRGIRLSRARLLRWKTER